MNLDLLTSADVARADMIAAGSYATIEPLGLCPVIDTPLEPQAEHEAIAGMLQHREVWETAVAELQPADFNSTRARDLFVRLRRLGQHDYRILRSEPWVNPNVVRGQEAIKSVIRAAAARDWVALGSTGVAA